MASDDLWFTHDGLKQVAYVYRPAGAGPHPVIIYNHGSRMGREREPRRWEDQAHRMSSRGYLLVVPERRGYGESDGSTFSDATRAPDGSLDSALFAPRMIVEAGDVLAVTEIIRQRRDVAPDRVFICGRSLGGIVTVLCAGRSAVFRGACNMCAAALTWDQSPHIQEALLSAARRTTIPMLLLQAHTDKSLAPTLELAKVYRAAGIRFGCTIYPTTLPDDHPMAGIIGGQWRWIDDMLEFFGWVERD